MVEPAAMSDFVIQNRYKDWVPFSMKKLQKAILQGSKNLQVDCSEVATKVRATMRQAMTSRELMQLAAEISANLCDVHPDYNILAARLELIWLTKTTPETFSACVKKLHHHKRVHEAFNDFVQRNAEKLDAMIRSDLELDAYDFFGLRTLMTSYLMKVNDEVVERPQYMLMRVAVVIWAELGVVRPRENIRDDLREPAVLQLIETSYQQLSAKKFTHASPTLFNAGGCYQALSSCFLLSMKEDSVHGIFQTLTQCAKISKTAGGIGFTTSDIRCKGSRIRGTNGISDGIAPMLRLFNDTSCYINQGGRRKGAFAAYIEPWHADIFTFLTLRRPHGNDKERIRELFYALWIPDIFMERVEKDEMWSLMCPDTCRGLTQAYGDEFNQLYTKYELVPQNVRKVVRARSVWENILACQQETGMPYMLYKDAVNRKTNHQNLGTIKSSNLCAEICQYHSAKEVACCNLASLALPTFINSNNEFDFEELSNSANLLTKHLDRIITVTYYAVHEARISNMKHRPLAVGIQGLADVFMLLNLPFDSPTARALNTSISETIYFGCLQGSCELAEKYGPYRSYKGSPTSKGLLQFDLWEQERKLLGLDEEQQGKQDKIDVYESGWRPNWSQLKARINKFGLRNSLVTAAMPTASTAHILGNYEAFEPLSSNLYVRRTMSGEFMVINRHLVKTLMKAEMWTKDIRDKIYKGYGSIQHIKEIPAEIKSIFRTVWEIPMKAQIDMAADRAPYIDQSQSFNCHLAEPTYQKLTAMHFYAWRKRLKTGMYYLRSNAPTEAIQYTVELTDKVLDSKNQHETKNPYCTRTTTPSGEDCIACSG